MANLTNENKTKLHFGAPLVCTGMGFFNKNFLTSFLGAFFALSLLFIFSCSKDEGALIKYTLTIDKPINGMIDSDAISCGDNGEICEADFDEGSIVTLIATAANSDYAIGDWGGDCTGPEETCMLIMDGDKIVNKIFKSIHDTGSVLSCESDLGISALTQPNIVPRPKKISVVDGKYMCLASGLTLVATSVEEQGVADFLNTYLTKLEWKSVVRSKAPSSNFVEINLEIGSSANQESYHMQTTERGVTISATKGSGLFYGVQSLIQMLPTDKKTIGVNLPVMTIEDEPRFQWRGMHLDVGRHFFPTDFIKKFINLMAFYKMNTFHWHLTEDQGWRIEIKKYPKLTTVGSRRSETVIGRNSAEYDGEPYGGFYTQEEIKEIVTYATERYITIVPEIEMPGHSTAALAAYPEYSCTPTSKINVATKWGVFYDIYCPSEETFTFLEDVLTEVMELFPGEYIHIGGDEAPKNRWEASTLAQNVIKREGLEDEHELQKYFIERIGTFLSKNNRKLIGWDEIREGGIPEGAAVMFWRPNDFINRVRDTATEGHDMVMSPTGALYFDYYQADPETEPLAIGGFSDTKGVYRYEPIPRKLSPEYHKHILGAQANVWTEYMPTSKHVEYMVFPRMLALSETVWSSPERKDWDDFYKRLSSQYKFLTFNDVNFHVLAPEGSAKIFSPTNEDGVEITLYSPVSGAKIYYTLDGNDPTDGSTVYSSPFRVSPTEKPVVKARIIAASGTISSVYRVRYELTISPKPAVSEDSLNLMSGIESTLYSWNANLKEFSMIESRSATAVSGTLDTFSLKTAWVSRPQFAIKQEGYIEVAKSGIYTFYTISDDGSALYIGTDLVVDNDGPHGNRESSGRIALAKGKHPIKVLYFEIGGAEILEVYYEGPDIEKKEIPSAVLFFNN